MNLFPSILVAVLAGVLGVVLTGLVGSACVAWYRISSFEGGAGYFVVYTAALGGVFGFVTGLVTSRCIPEAAGWPFLAALGISSAILVGLAGVGALLCWFLADVPPKVGGEVVDLEFEFRLPASQSMPPARLEGTPALRLGSVVRHVQRRSRDGELRPADARLLEGRWIIPGSAPLFTHRGLRVVSVAIGEQDLGGFLVPLPRRPRARHRQWSEWLPVRLSKSEPWPADRTSYRFRVARPLPPSPPPGPKASSSEAGGSGRGAGRPITGT